MIRSGLSFRHTKGSQFFGDLRFRDTRGLSFRDTRGSEFFEGLSFRDTRGSKSSGSEVLVFEV